MEPVWCARGVTRFGRTVLWFSAGVALLALTSCSTAPNWPELTPSDQSSEDTLPDAVLSEQSLDHIDTESIRFQWESGDTSYYSAYSTDDPDAGCLIVVDSDQGAETACSRIPPLTVEGENETVALGGRAPANEGWEQITPVFWRED